MRLIAGSGRGRKLQAPAGEHTRPTADRIKEAIFNIIQFDIEGRAVLDLFAGSGQMGLETLSRGAVSCVFADNDREACRVIAANLAAVSLSGGKVVQLDYQAFLKSAKGPFDLIFLDPPYSELHISKSLALIERFDILSKGGIIICESEKACVLPDSVGDISKGREYFYGITKVTLFRKDA